MWEEGTDLSSGRPEDSRVLALDLYVVPRSQETPPSYDPTVGLNLGSYNGRRRNCHGAPSPWALSVREEGTDLSSGGPEDSRVLALDLHVVPLFQR